MNENPKTIVEEEQLIVEPLVEEEEVIVDEFADLDVELLLPSMNSNQQIMPEPEECIVKDDQILGLYDEILDNCREDRKSADTVLANFLDMVMNDGDASSASKEAIVNLVKIKSDTSDKMAKIADLMTRIKLKEKDTFPRYMASQTNNKVVIEGSQRELIKSVNKMVNKKGKSE